MKNLLIALCALLLVACGGNSRRGESQTPKPLFALADVPSVYTDPASRAAYLLDHYWDRADFSDTAWLSHREDLEKALPDYLVVLGMFPPKSVYPSVNHFLDRTAVQPGVLDMAAELLEKYLYDPNSPMRNEEVYIPVLQYLVASDKLDSLEKIRPRHQLTMALKNRVGSTAADFRFTLANGAQSRMSTCTSTPYKILYLYNPECHGCEEVRSALESSPVVGRMLSAGELSIVAVYVDEDQDIWRRHKDEIPAAWINGRDEKGYIRDGQLYDLRAIPTLYLLDRSGTVLLKDVPEGRLFEYLENLPR